MEDKSTTKFLVIASCFIIIFSLALLGGCMWANFQNDSAMMRRGNTKHGLKVGHSKASELSWLYETPLNEGKTIVYHAAEKYPRYLHLMYSKNVEKRDLKLKIPSNMFEKEVELTTPKIQIPWLKNAASALNIRFPRDSKQGKNAFDDSYFLGPETSCRVPEGLQTIDIRCKIWPTYTRCISYCVYGSTFDEGIQREHSCKYKENKWSKDFDECKPFVNCKVQLKSPGKAKCFDNELSNKPYCEIYCEIHEDKDEVKTQAYHCNANATWSPSLPFCAQPKENVVLAKVPKVIEHTGFKYPDAYKPGTI